MRTPATEDVPIPYHLTPRAVQATTTPHQYAGARRVHVSDSLGEADALVATCACGWTSGIAVGTRRQAHNLHGLHRRAHRAARIAVARSLQQAAKRTPQPRLAAPVPLCAVNTQARPPQDIAVGTRTVVAAFNGSRSVKVRTQTFIAAV